MAKVKLNKSKKDKDLYWYLNGDGDKLWMYRHKYYDPLGNRREKKKSSFESEDAALKALLKVKADLLDGKHKQVEAENLKVSQWMDIWYETHKNEWKITTQIQRERAIKILIKPLIGNKILNKLDKSTYKRLYINKLSEKYKPGTVYLYHSLFKIAVNAAVDDEILPRNRFNKITIPNIENKFEDINDNFLSADELNTFIAFSEDHSNITNYNLMLGMAYTGLRKGEALGLQWKNIDFEAKTLTVERTRDANGFRSPKTKNSYRTIPVDDIVMNQLKRYKAWCKEKLFSYGKHLKDEDFVYISIRGNPIAPNSINRNLSRLIEKGNLKKISIHGLRHTHATILLNQGVSPNIIAERLGNTAKMIDEVYGHVLQTSKDKTVQIFAESLGAASGAN